MTWVTIAAAGIGAAGSIGGAYMSSQGKKKSGEGGGSRESEIDIPPFYNDPYVAKTQDFMFPYSQNLLEGEPNDYFAPIGQVGGPGFDDLLNMMKTDVTQSVTEDIARRGGRSGLGTAVIGKTVGDLSKRMRWEDYLRAMTGRQNLLNLGIGSMENVSRTALTNQGQVNNYNLGVAGIKNDAAGLGYKYDLLDYTKARDEQESEQTGWSELLSSGIGAIGNMYGTNMLNGSGNTTPKGSAAPSSGGAIGGAGGSRSGTFDNYLMLDYLS